MASDFWTVPREWAGETAFIIGGGPSVTQAQVDLLHGRRVIVINSSYAVTPWADYLIFSDDRWLEPPLGHWEKLRSRFQGRIVTASLKPFTRELLRLKRCRPPEFGFSPDTVCVNWTTYTAAINLACHLIGEGGSIVCLGLDGKKAPDGRKHHHAPHPMEWGRADTFAQQAADLEMLIEPLRTLRISCVNASPDTALAVFPRVNLENVLANFGSGEAMHVACG